MHNNNGKRGILLDWNINIVHDIAIKRQTLDSQQIFFELFTYFELNGNYILKVNIFMLAITGKSASSECILMCGYLGLNSISIAKSPKLNSTATQ